MLIGNDCTPSTLAAKKAYLQKIKAEKEEISKRMKSKAARLHPQVSLHQNNNSFRLIFDEINHTFQN